eukprot:gene1349-4525_t
MLIDPYVLFPHVYLKSGKANVSQFFDPLMTKDAKDGCYGNTFRGRSISGKRVDFPEGMVAVQFSPTSKLQSDMEESVWKPMRTFDSFTMWKLESHPQANDLCVLWAETAAVADAVHTPLIEEEIEELNKFYTEEVESNAQ